MKCLPYGARASGVTPHVILPGHKLPYRRGSIHITNTTTSILSPSYLVSKHKQVASEALDPTCSTSDNIRHQHKIAFRPASGLNSDLL